MRATLDPRAVLQHLAPGGPVSGAELAEQLGVTRAAVWKQIEALRAAGLPIEARTKVGYCLPWPIDLLAADRIQKALHAAGPPVEVHWELDSTQDALARLPAGAPDLTVVLAELQTQGRGRRGHGWASPPCLGLYLSCLKHFAGGPASLGGLSIAAGVCVAQALTEAGVPDLQLKWPNDVLVHGAKLAGVLIEVQGEYDGPCTARVGVGVNLRLPPALGATLGQPVTDLAALCGSAPPERNALAARLIDHLRAGLLKFEQQGLAPFVQDFARRDALAGQALTITGAGDLQQGVGCGIDARGALRVEHGGQVHTIQSSHVSVRPQPLNGGG